jgi:flagellar basal-body rod modification protein FlgD
MAVESIGAAPAATGVATNSTLGQEDFLRILLTQLQFQDPLKPIDNQEFIAQLAQFSGLEINRQVSEKTDTLLTIQAATQSLGLIGRTVEVNTDGGAQVGTVTAIGFRDGTPLLTVRTATDQFLTDVRLSQVALVRGA